MRVGAISDLHGYMPDFPEEQLDLLLIAGDVGAFAGEHLESFKGWSSTLGNFAAWLEDAGCPVVGIAGNHDFAFERDRSLADELPWTYLQDETVELLGLKIHGSPWVPTYGPWAFMRNDPDLEDRWDLIPDDVDVLLTHGPPFGYGDRTPSGVNAGSSTLGLRLLRINPRLHVYGHIHSGFGRWNVPVDEAPQGVRANVAHVAERYTPAHPIQVFYL